MLFRSMDPSAVAEGTAYDKRGITISPNRAKFGDTADWQADPFTSRDNRLASREKKTGSPTRLPNTDTLASRPSGSSLKDTIKWRTGNDEYGKIFGKDQTSQYANKPHLPEEGVAEDVPPLAKAAGGLAMGGIAAAGAPGIVAILGPLLGIPVAAYGAYSAAKFGMQGVEKLWDMAAKKLGGDDKVEQYANKIGRAHV